MAQQTTQLFEVEIKVHTTPAHPQFQKFKCGVLCLWLYAADVKSAVCGAIQIVKALPYKLGAAKSFPIDGASNLADWQVDGAAKASHNAPNATFLGYATEEKFSAAWGLHWPYLVPPL